MDTSNSHLIEVDLAAGAVNEGAEFAHEVYERYLDEQSTRLLECWGGDHLNGETLLCECPLCAPKPEPGCACALCRMVIAGRVTPA